MWLQAWANHLSTLVSCVRISATMIIGWKETRSMVTNLNTGPWITISWLSRSHHSGGGLPSAWTRPDRTKCNTSMLWNTSARLVPSLLCFVEPKRRQPIKMETLQQHSCGISTHNCWRHSSASTGTTIGIGVSSRRRSPSWSTIESSHQWFRKSDHSPSGSITHVYCRILSSDFGGY